MAEVETVFVPGSPRLAVDACGSGPVVVFLHGIGGNRTNWTDQLSVFGAQARALAWDARGYGQSDDYDGALDFADFSRDLLRLIDHFGARKVILVGLSMGGRIAQDFYDRHSDRVAAMALCSTRPGSADSLTDEQRAEFIRLRKAPLLAGKQPRDIAPTVAKTLMGRNCPPDKFQRLVDSISALHKESYIKTIEASMLYRRSAPLDGIKVPVLLVFGSEDTLTTPATGRSMAAAIAGSEYFEIADSGHLVNIEQPEIFNEKVLAFVARHAHRVA